MLGDSLEKEEEEVDVEVERAGQVCKGKTEPTGYGCMILSGADNDTTVGKQQ